MNVQISESTSILAISQTVVKTNTGGKPTAPGNTENTENTGNANSPASTFTRSNNQPVDPEAIQRAIQESRNQQRKFEALIQSMLNTQAGNFRTAWNNAIRSGGVRDLIAGIEVTDAQRAEAQELVSDDGFWGVQQTSERILAFARAYAGDDPDRIDRMQRAFERGFQMATNAWGSELPDISQRTRDAVLQGFDDMRAAAGAAQ